MNQSKHPNETTEIGRKIIQKFAIFDIEILREDYSTTVDFGREMSEPFRIQLERLGFDVIHEESSIYTLRYEYEC